MDWMGHQALSARPLSRRALHAHVADLAGRPPGKDWCLRFELRHRDELLTARPSGLDPKRAQNFNRTAVQSLASIRRQIEVEYGPIPPEHDWNADEKGIQLGGGRKRDGAVYYFMRSQKNRYRLASDNLELVTIVECISAAGRAMPPGIILKEGPEPDLRDVKGFGRFAFTF